MEVYLSLIQKWEDGSIKSQEIKVFKTEELLHKYQKDYLLDYIKNHENSSWNSKCPNIINIDFQHFIRLDVVKEVIINE